MLELEPMLRDRLKTAVPGLLGVYGLSELNAEKSRPTPCAYVVYDGARVVESPEPYDKARLAVRWLVVLAIKHVGDAADGAPARAAVAPLVSGVLKALMGWRPAGYLPLRLADCPRPDYQGGLVWLPLVFETSQIVKGD